MEKIRTTLMAGLLTLGSALACAADEPQSITVTSSAFDHSETIPLRHTAYGDNVSPRIRWSGLPEGTRQLALVVEDPDAPTPEPFVHWVVYNIPASADELPEGMSTDTHVASPRSLAGTVNGVNGTEETGYFGPRPPADGQAHAYHFRVHALDRELDLAAGLGRDALMSAIEDHVIGTGTLTGYYERTE